MEGGAGIGSGDRSGRTDTFFLNSSKHVGGVQAVMADGAVVFVNENISDTTHALLRRRNDGQNFDMPF